MRRQQQSIAPESALKRLQEIAASRQDEELENYRAVMEHEKEERLKRVQEERTRQDISPKYGVWSANCDFASFVCVWICACPDSDPM